MAKAGQALRQVLEAYEITQNKLAVAMGIRRGVVNSWVNEQKTPSSDAVLKIRDALESINPHAAEDFIRLYLEK